MATATGEIVYPAPPLPNKRGQGSIGGDFVVTYLSDFGQCTIRPPGLRYTNAGNFTAGTFLAFRPPPFILEHYPTLLSREEEEAQGIPLVLSMFNNQASISSIQEDWEGRWFLVTARVCPNQLVFQGVQVDGEEDQENKQTQVLLALPKDGGVVPIMPRLFGDTDKSTPWPPLAAQVSLAGPVDLDTFQLDSQNMPGTLHRTSALIKLSSYIVTENNRPPGRGVYLYHALLVFPLDQQPYSSLVGWMRESPNPFPRGTWIVCHGRILGILNRNLVQGPRQLDISVKIPVVLPDSWEFIRLNPSATPQQTPTTSRTRNMSVTPQIGRDGVATSNPFASSRNVTTAQPHAKDQLQALGTAISDIGASVTTDKSQKDQDSSSTQDDVELMVSDNQEIPTNVSPTPKRKDSSPAPQAAEKRHKRSRRQMLE